jgi:hypothetical protein
MVDVKHKTCLDKDCIKRPTYNIETETMPLYCVDHKLPNMIDICNKRCIHPNCTIQPRYNYENEPNVIYCSKHKLENMVNLRGPKCKHENCKTQPSFNYKDKKPEYCKSHKLDDMVDVTHKTCKTHLCDTRVNEKYEGYCLFCYIHIFPDKPVVRNYKTKEKAVADFIIDKFNKYKWVSDKTIHNGCSKRRPDLFLDLGYQIIIIEIDENQHVDYDCSCENKRIMELSQDVNHRPIIFIRFNPDDYIKDGVNITSCWSINHSGIYTVKKSKKSEWEERLDTLSKQVKYWCNPKNTTNKTVETIQLFY